MKPTLFIVLFKVVEITCDAAEFALYDKLLGSYSALERPVLRFDQPINVSMGLALQQIVDVVGTKIVIWANFILGRNQSIH